MFLEADEKCLQHVSQISIIVLVTHFTGKAIKMLHLREADLTKMYSLLISRARKSQRKPVLAFWGCKALYRAVQIFLQHYLFMIGHGWWWGWCAFLSLQKRQCVWATSQHTGQ